MPLDPNLICEAHRLALDVSLPADEARALAELLGPREELIAYLYLKRPGFQASPAVSAALMAAAKTLPATAAVLPPTTVDPAKVANARQDLRTALDAFIRSHTDINASPVEGALRNLAAVGSPTAFDLHLRTPRAR